MSPLVPGRRILDGHGTHDHVLLGLLDTALEFNIVDIAHRANADFLVQITLDVVSDIRAWIADQATALPAVVLATEDGESVLADEAVPFCDVRRPLGGFTGRVVALAGAKVVSVLRKRELSVRRDHRRFVGQEENVTLA